MTHEEIFQKVTVLASDLYDLSSERLWDKSKDQALIDCRTSVYCALIDSGLNFTLTEVAAFADKSHTTVLHHVSKARASERISQPMRSHRQDLILRNTKKLLKQIKEMV